MLFLKKKKGLILATQVALVAGFSYSFYSYVQAEVEPVNVYVFNKDLEVNSEVTKADLSRISVPAKAVTSDFALNVDDIVGKYVQTDVYANQFAYKKQLVDKGDIDIFDSMDMSKLRKISIPASFVNTFAGDIERGDKVDIVFTGEGKKETQTGDTAFRYSKVFLQNVPVYNVSTDEGYRFVNSADRTKTESEGYDSGESILTEASSGDLGIVTLAVTMDQAEEITARLSAGEVRLIGRFDEAQSYETMGYVIGEFGKVFAEQANVETGRATINDDNAFMK